MGAMVTIRYTNKVADEETAMLASAIRTLVTDAMDVKDVFVYVDRASVTIGADPIEVFVQVNKRKVADAADLMDKITEKLANWKRQNDFAHLINLNVIPVEWHAQFGI